MKRLTALCLALLQVGCAVPPPHTQPPELPGEAPLDVAAVAGEWPGARWWESYEDPTLNQLIERALADAPAMATAEARFSAAQESARVAAAVSGLRIDGTASVSRQRLSDNSIFSPKFLGFNWYSQADLGIQAKYTFDWWHRRRAIVAAAVNEARAAQAERAAANAALAAAIGNTYVAWQSSQARISLAREQLALLDRQRAVVSARIAAQIESADSLYRYDIELAEVREQIVVLESSAQLQTIALAAYVGTSPAQLPPLIVRPLPAIEARLPESARVDLLARRADIAASRWHVEAAQQQLAVARADFMPDISISALAALSSIDVARLLQAGSAAPSIGAALHLPIFDGGLLSARHDERAAQLQAAIATYNETLVNAAREVATQVQTLAQISAQRAAQQEQVAAAEKLAAVNAARLRQGLIDVRPQLSATQTLLNARDELAALDAAALSADIALKLALGGGYQSPPETLQSLVSSPK